MDISNGENKLTLVNTVVKRIAIIGPESTGKTWLAKKLSNHYNTEMVSEFAREYFNDKEYKYSPDILVDIAKGQLENEEVAALSSNGILFCDTDFIVMKIWSKVVFDFVPDWIEKQVSEHVYDLYLLCFPDLEWEPDSLRSNPHNRQYIYDLFVNELEENNFNYKVVKELGNRRIKNVISFVDELMA